MIVEQAVSSTALDRVRYDSDSNRLDVWFNDGDHRVYWGVPQLVFDGLVNAASVGRYFNAFIRDVYG